MRQAVEHKVSFYRQYLVHLFGLCNWALKTEWIEFNKLNPLSEVELELAIAPVEGERLTVLECPTCHLIAQPNVRSGAVAGDWYVD